MSHYDNFIQEIAKITKNKRTGFFTPYHSPKDFARQLAAPVITPVVVSGVAAMDALYAAFYLVKGLGQAITFNHAKASSSFNSFGNHFGGFVLATIMALTSPLLNFAAIFTRAAATCFKTTEPELDLTATAAACR